MSSSEIRRIMNIVESKGVKYFEREVENLNFQQTSKRAQDYKFFPKIITQDSMETMPAMSYGVAGNEIEFDTITDDGKETTNTALRGDVIISGPSKEKYAIKNAKFEKLYEGKFGSTVVPDSSPREVAQWPENKPATELMASWGDTMPVKPGDYIVKEPDGNGYYRIARKEYEQTYNPPGEIG